MVRERSLIAWKKSQIQRKFQPSKTELLMTVLLKMELKN